MSGNSFFTSLLTVLFIGLKITDNIDWSWFWVLSPLWISFSLGVFFLLIALCISAIEK